MSTIQDIQDYDEATLKIGDLSIREQFEYYIEKKIVEETEQEVIHSNIVRSIIENMDLQECRSCSVKSAPSFNNFSKHSRSGS